MGYTHAAGIDAPLSVIRGASPDSGPRAYTGPGSLEQLPLQIPDPQLPNDSLSLPIAQVDAAGTRNVDFWAIEPRDVVRVSCTVGPDRAETAVRDSFPGFGHLLR